MGTNISKAREDVPTEIRNKFTDLELDFIYKSFKDLAQRSPGNTIDKATFLRFFPLPGMHGERLFKVFDYKKAGVIDFEDFLAGLAICSRGTFEERVHLIFQLYDINDDNHVSRAELRTMLHQVPTKALLLMSATVQDPSLQEELLENANNMHITAKSEISMPFVDQLVDDAFRSFDLGEDDALSQEQFTTWVKNTPEVLNFLDASCPLTKGMNQVPSPSSSPAPDSKLRRSTDPNMLDSGAHSSASYTPRRIVGRMFSSRNKSLNDIGLVKKNSELTVYDSDDDVKAEHEFDPRAVNRRGYLYKVGRRTRTLVCRYFILESQVLYYYHNTRQQNPSGVIFLSGCFVSPVDEEVAAAERNTNSKLKTSHSEASLGRGSNSAPLPGISKVYGFEVITSQGGERDSRIFYTKTLKERVEWMEAIKASSNVIPFSQRYQRLDKIGTGKFASVYRCRRINAKEEAAGGPQLDFAVKIISKQNIGSKESELLRTEIAILKLVNHPNIINLEDVFESLNHIYIVLELMRGGELFNRILGHSRLTEEEAFCLIVQLLEAVRYLHVLGVAHRDIKPENILCSGKASDPLTSCTLKLCDFGLSKLIAPNGVMTVACGTLSYVAPEVLSCQGYGKAADLWSIGVIIYLLRRGKLPFDGDSKMAVVSNTLTKKLDFAHDRIFSKSSVSHVAFVQGLLEKDPSRRLTAEQALHHPWIAEMRAQRETKVLESHSSGDLKKSPSEAALPPRVPTMNSLTRKLSNMSTTSGASHAIVAELHQSNIHSDIGFDIDEHFAAVQNCTEEAVSPVSPVPPAVPAADSKKDATQQPMARPDGRAHNTPIALSVASRTSKTNTMS